MKKARILVADDSEMQRIFFKHILSGIFLDPNSYTVIEAGNGEEARQKFRHSHQRAQENEDMAIDLVITDLSMGEVTGVDLAFSIRGLDKNVPIILCSSHDGKLFEEIGSAHPDLFNEMVHKPILIDIATLLFKKYLADFL